ncbi:hypothetical protein BDY19DRAFT_1056622 [Irpex rosettiformis]|uniref:Uncharacterized protein n=1 Tax=Irpex rosettiformis TaxID=378272 RepID=A0ACB8U5Y0_9APHY|nr:hypothetical protein BDY19DRAFT_1056622 [Irpex rosettiformis]
MDFNALQKLSRSEIQKLAKREKIKANAKTQEIISQLVKKYPEGVPRLVVDDVPRPSDKLRTTRSKKADKKTTEDVASAQATSGQLKEEVKTEEPASVEDVDSADPADDTGSASMSAQMTHTKSEPVTLPKLTNGESVKDLPARVSSGPLGEVTSSDGNLAEGTSGKDGGERAQYLKAFAHSLALSAIRSASTSEGTKVPPVAASSPEGSQTAGDVPVGTEDGAITPEAINAGCEALTQRAETPTSEDQEAAVVPERQTAKITGRSRPASPKTPTRVDGKPSSSISRDGSPRSTHAVSGPSSEGCQSTGSPASADKRQRHLVVSPKTPTRVRGRPSSRIFEGGASDGSPRLTDSPEGAAGASKLTSPGARSNLSRTPSPCKSNKSSPRSRKTPPSTPEVKTAAEAGEKDILQKSKRRMDEGDQLEKTKVMLGNDSAEEAVEFLHKRRKITETLYVRVMKKGGRLYYGKLESLQEPEELEVDHSDVREESDDQKTSDVVAKSDPSSKSSESMDESGDDEGHEEGGSSVEV